MLSRISADRIYLETWSGCALLARLVLKEIAAGADAIFSENIRSHLAKLLGTDKVKVSLLQSSLRQLERKGSIGRTPDKHGEYFIDDPNFKN